MKGRIHLYIITLLVSIVLVLPGILLNQTSSSYILDDKTITISIIRGLPALALLLFISLYGSPDDRRRRGWNQPVLSDFPVLLILLTLTVSLSFLFPAADSSYTVQLSGWKGRGLIIILALSTAFTEELFFRSWLLSTLPALGWPRWLVFVISVVFFASLHLWQGWSAVFFAAVSGAAFSICFFRRPGLFVLITAHTIHNAMALIMMTVR
ncbi:MAG: CPBP family intramembrane metalloprotease [Spirochaetaceae bacterium]|nr:CPBP family intramembrane metalloprotease [Spirochaetaceae bacterium]